MKQPWPHVAVVILNWNGRSFLERFLPSVLQTQYPACTVVVADNASTDDSVAFVRRQYPQIQLVINSENGGFARGYNQALKQVQADYYVLLNSDVEVTPGWITPVIELMEANAGVAACQPKILSWHEKDHFEYAGAAGGFMDRLCYPFARGRLMDVCETDRGQYNQPIPVFWASGAAMFIKSRMYHEAGGLDEYFFAHQEEIDLCWRLQRMGYKIYACPQSVVYHVGGGTLPQGNPRKTFLNFRNSLVMMRKNLHPSQRYGKLAARLLLDAVAALRFLLKGQGRSFLAVFRSHLAFYRWRGANGKTALPYKKLEELDGVSGKLLVWQFFIKKKKRFEELMK